MSDRSTRWLFAITASPFLILGALFLSVQASLLDEELSAQASIAAFFAGAVLFFAAKALAALRRKPPSQPLSGLPPVLVACFRTGCTLMFLAVLNSIGLFAASQVM